MKPNLRIGVVYDFRNPVGSGVDNKTFYSELMEQAVWLENLALDLIWFTEHHFVDDALFKRIKIKLAEIRRVNRRMPTGGVCLAGLFEI